MSRFESIPLEPRQFCFRRATLACGILSILVLLSKVIYYDSNPTRDNASYTYPNFKYKSDEKHLHHIVSDASSVVGTHEWIRKKEAELEERKIHVQEVCAELNSKDRWTSTDQGRHFWFDIRHGFAVCTHPKVRLMYYFIFHDVQRVLT